MRPVKPAAVLAAIVSIAIASSCGSSPKLPAGLYARLETSKGPITISLAYDKAPLAATNFVGLAEGTLEATGGKRFYDGLSFHRVESGFVIQGGDPNGDGSGDPGYNFPDEFDPSLRHDGPGVVALANYGPDTNGCQFYITLAPAPVLDDSYTVFGRVAQGMDIVGKIAVGDVIRKVTIVRVGRAAKAFKTDQEAWNARFSAAENEAKARVLASRKAIVDGIMARWPGLEARPDGMLSKTLASGSGPAMQRGWLAKISYKGMLPDGRVFDQSILHGGPYEFEIGVGHVILGWDTIVQDMKKGEKRVVAIPPELAYGMQGVAGVIPPNSFIVFEIELSDYSE